MIFFHVRLKPTKIVKTKKLLVHARSRMRIQHYPLQGKQLVLTKTKNLCIILNEDIKLSAHNEFLV